MIVNTGIVMTAADKAEALRRSVEVRETPVVFVHGTWLHESAQLLFWKWVDGKAAEYGLPEPGKDEDGDVVHYGISNDGEFTTWVDDDAAFAG